MSQLVLRLAAALAAGATLGLAAASVAAPAPAAASSDVAARGTIRRLAVLRPRAEPPEAQRAVDDHSARLAAPSSAAPSVAEAAPPDGLASYTFFPQAGVQGRDLFLNNFADLDPAANKLRDWDCSGYTYDGHQGHDSLIRSFREQDIGVPVFAALDGTVASAHDGEYDVNLECSGVANSVILDHGGGHRSYYWHLRTGSVAVVAGQSVRAGTQLGLTASSGCSTWPHLHFESRQANAWYEPSAGGCRDGASQWTEQPPVPRDLQVVGFYLTDQQIPFTSWRDLAEDLDPALRRSWVRTGGPPLQFRIDVHNIPGGAGGVLRVLDPKGRVAAEEVGTFANTELDRFAIYLFELDVPWTTVGTWRVQLRIADTLVVDAPFRVVKPGQNVANRPPRSARPVFAKPPQAEAPTVCTVAAALIDQDPDYDLVRYRYEWKAGKRALRTVTSAALSDVLPAGAAAAGETLSCTVTPNDGKKNGPKSSVSQRVQ